MRLFRAASLDVKAHRIISVGGEETDSGGVASSLSAFMTEAALPNLSPDCGSFPAASSNIRDDFASSSSGIRIPPYVLTVPNSQCKENWQIP